MMPQAMRAPELPLGSVFMSSASAWTITGGAAVGEDVVGLAGAEREVVDGKARVNLVIFIGRYVFGHVAGMVAHGVLKAVLLGVRIEVGAGGFEVGDVAGGYLVDVDAVRAGGEVFEVERDFELAAGLLFKADGARILVAGGHQAGGDLLVLGAEGRERRGRIGPKR